MKRTQYLVLLIAISTIVLSGCRSLNPSVMLKTDKGFQYSQFPTSPSPLYKISPNDELSFKIYSNDGFKLIDVTTMVGVEGASGIRSNMNAGGGLSFKVEFDGTIKLPLLGRTALKGMTMREAETFLEEKYSAFYNKPYVMIEITNRRFIIFPGSEGTAKVVRLENENTTLIEGLAAAGGIARSGKAYKVKLIRGDLKKPEVYLIDLSTIDGMKQAELILQANDIIYIEPQLRIGRDVMSEIMPYLTFLTTAIIFIEFISRRTP